MYSAEQTSRIKEAFWTTIGKYLSSIPGAENQKVNWVNYKTGIKGLFFKMNATKNDAQVAVEIMHKDPELADRLYNQFKVLRKEFEGTLLENWKWEDEIVNEHGATLSRISKPLTGVNILKEEDWPRIIAFLKPRIILLDKFWSEKRTIFEML